MISDRPTIVIGGGAAGLLAAGRAAQRGAKVLLLEKMEKPGRKIGISGKGRCNITNSAELIDFLNHFGKNGRFLRQCFHHFFIRELLALLEENGVKTVLERGGRYFPASGRAMDVVRCLIGWAQAQGVRIQCGSPVEKIVVTQGEVAAVVAAGSQLPCQNVILATGGRSYPRTGSTGDGYRFLAELGHDITRLHPALVPLRSDAVDISSLEGLNLRNTTVRLFIDGKKRGTEFGEITFLSKRVSGPTMLTLSGTIVPAIDKGQEVKLLLDLKPALDEQRLDTRLRRDLEKRQGEEAAAILRGLLPAQLIPHCLAACRLAPDATAIPAKTRQRLRYWLKNFSIPITGYGGWDEAIVTAGGLSLQEVNPQTMESRLVRGLYIAGELLDLHGDTGGFNLQAAFSTGWLAGDSIRLSL